MYFLNILCDIFYVKVCCNLCLVINKNILQKKSEQSLLEKQTSWASDLKGALIPLPSNQPPPVIYNCGNIDK